MDDGRSRNRFGVQQLLLCLAFLILAAVLTRVFSSAWAMSRQAAQKNDAVELCRNAAERFAADGAAAASPLYYDGDLNAADEAEAVYRLETRTEDEATGAGTLRSAVFSVYCGEECLFTLDDQVYLPQSG